MKGPLMLSAWLALALSTNAQQVEATRLGSFHGPTPPRAWLDAPRAILTELGVTGKSVRAAGDVNGDGRADLLAFPGALGDIVPIYNVAPDQYVVGAGFGTSRSSRVIAVGDMTGNGFPDIVTDNGDVGAQPGLIFHANDGGTYESPVFLPSPGLDPWDGTFGQADTDPGLEFLEIYSVNGGAYTARWWNEVGGTLQPGPSLLLGSLVSSVVAIDLNGDGVDEILAAFAFPDEVRVLETAPNGSLTVVQVIEVDNDNIGFDPYFLAAGDVDGDGDPDAIVTWLESQAFSGYDVQVLENVTGVTLSARSKQTVPTSVADPVLVDWDDDGDLDIVGTAGSSGNAQLENDGTGRFELTGRSAGPSSAAVAVIDFNDDGYLDVLTSSFLKAGNGKFEDNQTALTSVMQSGRAIDVDQDGDLDVVEQANLVYFNDGDATFTSATLSSLVNPALPPATSQVRAAGDFDGDGLTDLVSWVKGGAGNFTEVLLRGIGGGQFTYGGGAAPLNLAITDSFRLQIAPADLDGDGDLDILSRNGWAENDGDGFFATVHPAWSSLPLAVADVDNDGDLDVAVSTSFVGWLYRNDGSGGFTSEPLAPTAYSAGAFADFDGDGFPSFVTNNAFDDTVEIVENVSGTFPNSPIVLSAPEQTALLVDDFDGDGVLDVLATRAAHNNSSETTVIFRHSDGPTLAFDPLRTYFTRVGPAVSGDFDGDGDLDLLRYRMLRNWRRQPLERAQVPTRRRR